MEFSLLLPFELHLFSIREKKVEKHLMKNYYNLYIKEDTQEKK